MSILLLCLIFNGILSMLCFFLMYIKCNFCYILFYLKLISYNTNFFQILQNRIFFFLIFNLSCLNHNHFFRHIFIVMEYCNEGDLAQYIRKKHKLMESLVKVFIQQLALALKYLQQYNICHMDLKTQNLLIQSQPKLKLKLADFGYGIYLIPNAFRLFYTGTSLGK